MKRSILLFFVLAFTACTQCSKSKKEEGSQNTDDTAIEKTIKTFIIYADYYPESTTIGDRHYEEYFQWLYEAYCYKTLEHYSHLAYPYKGNIVDGKLIAKVYKKDGSFIIIPVTTSKSRMNLNRGDRPFNQLVVEIYMSYSGQEVKMEVRRLNEQKNEDVLLFQREIPAFNENMDNAKWEKVENSEYTINGSGFNKKNQCHISPGHM